jgi:outer membrane receptor protein involved in Fe transport
MNTFDLFAQDSWQLMPNLSVDYGVRVRLSATDAQRLPESLRLSAGVDIGSQGLAFQGNQISSVYPSDWANISPRVGFSYSP